MGETKTEQVPFYEQKTEMAPPSARFSPIFSGEPPRAPFRKPYLGSAGKIFGANAIPTTGIFRLNVAFSLVLPTMKLCQVGFFGRYDG